MTTQLPCKYNSFNIVGMIKQRCIILFKFITMFSETDNILHNLHHIQTKYGEFSTKYIQSHKTMLWVICLNMRLCIWLSFEVSLWTCVSMLYDVSGGGGSKGVNEL